MSPIQKETINGTVVEKFYWNGKYVTYVNNRKVEESFDSVVNRLREVQNFINQNQVFIGE